MTHTTAPKLDRLPVSASVDVSTAATTIAFAAADNDNDFKDVKFV